MKVFSSEAELIASLKMSARQIDDCILGRITFDNFLSTYNNFYDRYALDGHESDDEEIAHLQK